MLTVGRSAQEQALFAAQLVTHHQMRVRVTLQLANTGQELADLTPRLVDGQVTIDASQKGDTTRGADVTLDDPDHSIGLDGRGMGDGALFVDRALAIDYGVFVDALQRWIDVPIFRGPIVGLSRDGTALNLTCLGREYLCKGNAWLPMTFKKGHDTTDAIRALLRERGGETTFAFPANGGRLADDFAVGRLEEVWTRATDLADSINRQLYYDGNGTCRLRSYPDNSVWTFTTGDGGSVLSLPQVSYDLSSTKNLVWVKGRKPKHKPAIKYVAIAPTSHPLNPAAIGRNGVPRYLVAELDNDQIRDAATAKDRGDRELARLMRESVDVSFDALPVPHLEPYDVVTVVTGETSLTFPVLQFSIPLTHDGVMSVGTVRQVTPTRPAAATTSSGTGKGHQGGKKHKHKGKGKGGKGKGGKGGKGKGPDQKWTPAKPKPKPHQNPPKAQPQPSKPHKGKKK